MRSDIFFLFLFLNSLSHSLTHTALARFLSSTSIHSCTPYNSAESHLSSFACVSVPLISSWTLYSTSALHLASRYAAAQKLLPGITKEQFYWRLCTSSKSRILFGCNGPRNRRIPMIQMGKSLFLRLVSASKYYFFKD